MTIGTPKGFHEEQRFAKEEKKVPRPCQWCQYVSLSFSMLLCPRLPAISLRLLLQGPPQQAGFLPLLTVPVFPEDLRHCFCGHPSLSLPPSLLHLSHRSNNNAALFKHCCTRLSHLQAFKWEVYQVSIV